MDRRQFLGALGVTAGGVGGLSTRIHLGSLLTWTPDRGTWPLHRYDLGNTAANREATPPTSPSLAWQSEPVGGVHTLVADRTQLYIGAYSDSREQLRALDRRTGETRWSRDIDCRALAVHDGRLYVTAWDHGWGLDAATGATLWSRSLPKLYETNLLVAGDQLFVAGRTLLALDAATGETRWHHRGGRSAIADDALISMDGSGELRRFASRRLSDFVTGAPPPVLWENGFSRVGPPVVGAEQVLVGTDYSGDLGLTAADLATGAVEWVFETDTDGGHAEIGAPAVAEGRGFADRNYGEPGGINFQDLVAISLSDGSLDWEYALEPELKEIIIAGKTVLVGTGFGRSDSERTDPDDATGGGVQAFSMAGEKRWQFDTDIVVNSLIAVDDTIYLGTGTYNGVEPGHVYALS